MDSPTRADIVIRNVTTIDAINDVRSGVDVFLTADKISAIRPTQPNKDVHGDRIINGEGKFLIPGLWDSHVHLTFDEKVQSSMNRLFIANGVTSVRDTGGQLDAVLLAKQKALQEESPTIYIAGPLLDGEPTVYAGESRGFPRIGTTLTNPSDAVRKVDDLVEAGVNLIKAYEMLSPEVFRAVVERAQYHGLPVTGHVPLSMTAKQASAAGLSSLEHFRNLQMACATNQETLLTQRIEALKNSGKLAGSKLRAQIHADQHFTAVANNDPARCAELVSTLAENQTWQVPTMALLMMFKKPFFGRHEWQANYQYLPPMLASEWLKRSKAFAERLAEPSEKQNQRIKVADWQIDFLNQLIEAGVPIMAGTDTPIVFLTPGFSLHLELQTLVEAGITPMQALQAATLNPARYFGLQDSLGSIDEGKMADLVLLDKNPLVSIRNTKTINAVVKGGRWLERTTLDELLTPPATF